MSSELIATWFWTKGTSTLDVETAKRAVDDAQFDELAEYSMNATGEGINVPGDPEYLADIDDKVIDDLRRQAKDEIDEIATLIPDADGAPSYSPNGFAITSPSGDTLWFAGGTSYGDDPNETYTAMSNIINFPRLLKALRGAGDWTENTPAPHVKEAVLPLPNEVFDCGIAIASVWSNDDPAHGPIFAQVIVLRPTPAYYVVEEITWKDGEWKPTVRTGFVNIVEATNDYQQRGGDI